MNEGDKKTGLILPHGFNMDGRAASQSIAFLTIQEQFGHLSHMPESDSGPSNSRIPIWLQMAGSTHIPTLITTLLDHSMMSNGSAQQA